MVESRFSGLWLSLIVFAGVLVYGCGGSPGGKQSSPGEGKIHISVNRGPKEGEVLRRKWMDRRLELFAQRYPDIEVEVRTWDYTPESFVAKMAGGTCPDLVNTWATEGPMLMDHGLARDITDLFERWEGRAEIRPVILSPFQREGRVYGLPFSAYSISLYYNKRLFREAGLVDAQGRVQPPQTWEEFVDAAVRLTDPGRSQVGFAVAGAKPFAGWHFLNWTWQAGGEFEEKVDGRWTAVFDRAPVVRALGFLKELRWKHVCVQKNILADNDDILRMFAASEAAMIIEPANDNSMVVLVERYGFDLDQLGISQLPAGPAGRATQFGADYYIINAHVPDNRLEACFAWMTFSVSPEWIEAREAISAEFGYPSGCPYVPIFTGKRAEQWEATLARHRNVPVFEYYGLTVTETLRAEPPYFCQQLYSEALSPAVQEVLRDPEADPGEVLRRYGDSFQSIFLDRLN